ncbi:heterokaryon incompatibility protein-domain-containing protein [Pisolithus marmoratus]|nr:heterokaryon incompatibility protein-domain-containing protein [Pisolithus marmoratus]
MRLVDVAAILGIERNIDQGKEVDPTHEIFGEFYGPDLDEKEYAILSHCWGVAKQGVKEVSFQEMENFVAMSEGKRTEIRRRTGYKKIINTCRRARKDGLNWVWIDTCCINKESSSELSEAINSMYKWYANAEPCYAYLHDTVGNSWTSQRGSMAPPKWFSRGWTLQELIAPKVVRFFDQEWERTGDKAELADVLSRITQIPWQVLKEGLQKAFSIPSVAQIFSWAANRTTSREEDRAYSLLGLLGVHMPMLYGEGKNAFRHLQLEIIRTSNDQTIFAWEWTRQSGWSCRILADDPSRFKDCHSVIALDPRLVDASLRESGMPDDELDKLTQARLRTFKVTNDGIQIWLPTATLGPYSQVMLGCRDRQSKSLTVIHLVICGSTCCRIFSIPVYSGKLEFMQHFLPYNRS